MTIRVKVLIHYVLPFSEDLRLFQFPELERMGKAPNGKHSLAQLTASCGLDYQLDLVDNYIDAMMLVDDPDE